jgi:hypothetical protein
MERVRSYPAPGRHGRGVSKALLAHGLPEHNIEAVENGAVGLFVPPECPDSMGPIVGDPGVERASTPLDIRGIAVVCRGLARVPTVRAPDQDLMVRNTEGIVKCRKPVRRPVQ